MISIVTFLRTSIGCSCGTITNFHMVEAFTISLPCTNKDFQELASLLVSSFDDPLSTASSTTSNLSNTTSTVTDNGDNPTSVVIDSSSSGRSSSASNSDDTKEAIAATSGTTTETVTPRQKFEQITWSLYDKYLTTQYTYRQYVQTARKMKGKKYSLYLAKEYNPGIDTSSDGIARPFYEVIGMVELGMVLEQVRISESTRMNENESVSGNDNDGDNGNQGRIIVSNVLRPRATVGVLCVKEGHMNKGVGRALLNRCEEEAREVWNETQLYIEVEPSNDRAKHFFLSCGYHPCIDDNGSETLRYAKVCRRRKVEERPHLVLSKKI